MKIGLKNISRNYKNKKVIDNFSWNLDFNKNDIFALLGPNGSCKTTILKIISGIYSFESGSIESSLDNNNNYFLWARKNISFLPAGDRAIRFRNSVYDNARYFGALKGINPYETKQLYSKYSKLLSMEEFRDRKVGNLSSGEKKKALLLSALSTSSKIIILDEPSDGLDISSKIDLENIIKEISINENRKFII